MNNVNKNNSTSLYFILFTLGLLGTHQTITHAFRTTHINTPLRRHRFYAETPSAEFLSQLDQTFDYPGRVVPGRDDFRCGFVAIVGAANMGKSTVINALLREDLCIATARPQTTRHAILGLLTTSQCQVCLVDTPGVIREPAYKLQQGMMEAVNGAVQDADVVIVVTDLFSTPIPNDKIWIKVQKYRKPVIVCINKIDLVDKVNRELKDPTTTSTTTVEQAVAQWRQWLPEAWAILPITAAKGIEDPGIQTLRDILTGGPDVPAAIRNLGRPIEGMFPPGVVFRSNDEAQALLPVSPPLYDQELLTDRTERFIASEIIRAALFQSLKKELPYCCEVQITEFKEPTDKPIIRMAATVVVERDSQKKIVIGKNGEQIKAVGILARQKLEEFFQTQIFLNLQVKVDKDWRKNEERLKAYGYINK